MTSEQLALLVGYDLQQIAKSLDLLVQRKLLRRAQNPTHAARLYRFRADQWGPRFHEILEIASTVEGRRQIRRLVSKRPPRPKKTSPHKTSPHNSLSSGSQTVSQIKEKAHG
jgi:hypothetical protein